jgi:hypothetical protein
MQENVPAMAILLGKTLALASIVLRGCLAESALAIVPLLLMLVNELLMADSAPCAKTGTPVTKGFNYLPELAILRALHSRISN